MQFALGFLSASLLYFVFFCIYVFVYEENKKRKVSRIVPGQSYHVQSIGKVLVKKVTEEHVTYECEDGEIYDTEPFIFWSTAKILLKDTKTIMPKSKKTDSEKVQEECYYYDKRSKVYTVKID